MCANHTQWRRVAGSHRLGCIWPGGSPSQGLWGIWGWWQQRFLWNTQQWHLISQVSYASSRGISNHRDPHWHPLCCIHTANRSPHPTSSPLNPCFSTQPSPALQFPSQARDAQGLSQGARFFQYGHSEVKWYFIVVVLFIYLKISNVEHLLMCLLVICMSFWKNAYLSLLSIVFIELFLFFVFLYWIIWTICIFWILTPHWSNYWQIFSPIP